MRRRTAIVGLGAAAASLSPDFGRAQQPLTRVGYIHAVSLSPSNSTLQILRPLWTALGLVEGKTILLRTAGGDASRLPGIVADLLSENVAIIIAVGAEALLATAAATKTVAIVGIDLETDPLKAGLAASYARPGGNVTGVFLDQPSMAAKWIELLREAVPAVRQVAFLWDPSTGTEQLAVARDVASGRGLTASTVEWRKIGNFDEALSPFRGGETGIVTLTSPGMSTIVEPLNRTVAALSIPTLMFLRTYLQGGVLASYGPDQGLHFSRAMTFVRRILAGERPGDLPIELPSRYELVVDLRAARAIGLSIAPSLLARADEVIE